MSSSSTSHDGYQPADGNDEENVFDDPVSSSSRAPGEPSYSAVSSGGGGLGEPSFSRSSGVHDSAMAADSSPDPSSSSPLDGSAGGVANPFELDSISTQAAIDALPAPPVAPLSPGPVIQHLDSESWADMFWATATNNQRLQTFCYSRCLLLSITTQIVMLLLFAAVEPTAIKYHVSFSASMTVLLLLCELMQVAIIVLAHLGMATELTALYVRPGKIWNMYLSTVLAFAALYFTFFCFQRSSFQVDGYAADAMPDVDTTNPEDTPYEDLQTSNDIPTIFIYFMYFSGAIMTSTGFGDIAPTLWYSQILTNCQMLLGTMYHVGVFGLTLSHFRTFQKVSEAKDAADLIAGRNTLLRRIWNRWAALPWVMRIRAHPRTALIQRFCIRHLVLACVVFQACNTVLLLSIPDPFRSLKPSDPGYSSKVVVLTFITLFQTAMFLGVMYVSIRLVKQINNADITPGFLVQSFLATALLFGGIYFVLFAATPSHQFSRHTAFDLTVFEVLYVFVHFSLTVMTTTGFGDVFVLAQMLISILYSAVIIGLGTSQLIDMQAAKAEADFKAKEIARIEQAKAEAEAEAEAQTTEQESHGERRRVHTGSHTSQQSEVEEV